jgi:hypothetical protein
VKASGGQTTKATKYTSTVQRSKMRSVRSRRSRPSRAIRLAPGEQQRTNDVAEARGQQEHRRVAGGGGGEDRVGVAHSRERSQDQLQRTARSQ